MSMAIRTFRLKRLLEILDEPLSLIPIVVLGIGAALLILPGGRVEPAHGGSSVASSNGSTVLQTSSPAVEDAAVLLIGVGAEQAVQLRQLLEAESALRGLLGEAPRRANVVEANDHKEAERIADAVLTQLDVLGTALSARVIP
jgi:hypothetical protein